MSRLRRTDPRQREPELHREDFAVISDAKGLSSLPRILAGTELPLALIIELGRGFGDLDGFACIGQLDGLGVPFSFMP